MKKHEWNNSSARYGIKQQINGAITKTFLAQAQ